MEGAFLAVSHFDRVSVVLGCMLVVGALVAGLARRSFLSLTAVFVLGGFALGKGGLDLVSFDPRSGFVPAEVTHGDERGWGLFIVDQLSSQWGVIPGERTAVWFEIALRSA